MESGKKVKIQISFFNFYDKEKLNNQTIQRDKFISILNKYSK